MFFILRTIDLKVPGFLIYQDLKIILSDFTRSCFQNFVFRQAGKFQGRGSGNQKSEKYDKNSCSGIADRSFLKYSRWCTV